MVVYNPHLSPNEFKRYKLGMENFIFSVIAQLSSENGHSAEARANTTLAIAKQEEIIGWFKKYHRESVSLLIHLRSRIFEVARSDQGFFDHLMEVASKHEGDIKCLDELMAVAQKEQAYQIQGDLYTLRYELNQVRD